MPDSDPLYYITDEMAWPEKQFDEALARFGADCDVDELAEQVERIIADQGHPAALRLAAAFDAVVARAYSELVDQRCALIAEAAR